MFAPARSAALATCRVRVRALLVVSARAASFSNDVIAIARERRLQTAHAYPTEQ